MMILNDVVMNKATHFNLSQFAAWRLVVALCLGLWSSPFYSTGQIVNSMAAAARYVSGFRLTRTGASQRRIRRALATN
jgi:hypothetical protein